MSESRSMHSLDPAGVIFIAENDEGPGVRMRKMTDKGADP